MKIEGNVAKEVKITYVGGGSRGWAWKLMSDLATCPSMSGDVCLYDIDYEAAQDNVIIGNKYNTVEGSVSHWNYYASKTISEALTGADFVVISILPGTFKEMGSDVHTPEKYGIYQAVGDTSGPGGIVRAMRTIPMYEELAEAIKTYCPNAWVINYTNPMTWCTKTLYRVFPEIKAFGCCHEIFSTQKLLASALEDICGITVKDKSEVRVTPVSVNHFTWLVKAQYKNIDLYPVYEQFVNKYYEAGYTKGLPDNWQVGVSGTSHRLKFDLFRRYGVIAAAGDRHLAEFCEGKWYLKDPETVKKWGYALTPISYRNNDLKERLRLSGVYKSGEKTVPLKESGEEGVMQMCALLGLREPLVTNVNIPNQGQTPNLPAGAVVESNAVFSANSVIPVQTGDVPASIYPMVARICGQQEAVSQAIAERDIKKIFAAFCNDPLVTCNLDEAKELFKEMVLNTKEYLTSYDLSQLDEL